MSFKHILFAIIVAISWGGNFVASKYAVAHFPAIFTILLRYIIVAIVLIPFAGKQPLDWVRLNILALLMCSLHFALVFAALKMGLDVSTAVVAIQIGVPFTVVLGTIFLKDQIGMWRTMGLTIAFMGLLLFAGTPNVEEQWVPFLMAVAGAFCWASSNVYAKTIPEVKIIPLVAWSSLYALPQLLVATLVLESNHIELLETMPMTAGVAILYSAIISTIVAYGLWYHLLRLYPVSQVTPFSLLIPFIGIGLAVTMLGETLSADMILGACVTMVGVAMIVFRKPKLAKMSKV